MNSKNKFKAKFQKLTVMMLVFSFIFSSVLNVLAAEMSTSEIPAEEQAAPATDANDSANEPIYKGIEDQKIYNLDTENKNSTDKTKAFVDSNMSTLDSEGSPNFSDGRKPVTNNIKVETDNAMGALVYSYPLEVPPGRNGMQPDLKLVYNSQVDENYSIFGFGWSLNIPYIERINRKGVEKLYSENYFTSYLDGELIHKSTSSSEYAAKIESGFFNKYEYINSTYWKMTDKNGATYLFGISTSTRQNNADKATNTAKWMLEEVRDLNNNYIKYEYSKDRGQIYPEKIKYTGYNNTDGIFEVDFLKETRSDAATTTNYGFKVKTNYRIYEIDTKINNDWVKKYSFSYTTGDNGIRSILGTMQVSGRDEDNVTISLPSDSNEYQKKTKAWEENANWDIPVDFTINGYDQGSRLADVNGDGLVDILRSEGMSPAVRKVYINRGDGTGWSEDTNWGIPVDFTYNSIEQGTKLADVNGDGLVDILYSEAYYPAGNAVYLNKGDGTGWAYDSNWSIPVDFAYNGNVYDVRLEDVNGDGLVDILYSEAYYPAGNAVYLNKGDGTGWAYDSNWSIPVNFTYNGTDEGTRLADVNGDGLMDIIHANGGESPSAKKVYINKGDGTGWAEDAGWGIPVNFTNNSSGIDDGTRLADVNGDGLIDIIHANGGESPSAKKVYINKGDGTGWVEDANWGIPVNFTNNASGVDEGTRLIDVNGDGLIDFLHSDGGYSPSTKKVYVASAEKADLLKAISHGSGAVTSIQYKGSAEYLSTSDEILNKDIRSSLITVFKISNYDGISNYSTTTYEYSGGDFYYNDPFDKRFAGFQKIKKSDDLGNYTLSYYHQGNTSSSTIGEYNDDQSKIGRVYRIEQYDPSDNLYTKTINKWENYDLGSEADFVKLTRTTEFAYDGDTDHKEKAQTYEYDNTYGNQTTKITWGEVSGSDDGSFTDIGSDKASTTVTYAASTTPYIVGLPSREITNDQNSNKVKETKYYYDNLTLGNVSKGNLTKQEDWKSGTSYIDIEKTYNSYGLVTTEKDPRDKTTTSTYDYYNLYVATSTNPLSQTTQYYYDYSCGKAKKIIDPNSRVFETVFDGLDRPTVEKQPDIASPTTLVTKKSYVYYDFLFPHSIKQTDYLDATTSIDSFTYLDGFDRPIQDRKRAEEDNTYSIKDYSYNKLGLLEKESLPYFSTGTSTTAATTTNSLFSWYTYDALARVKTLTNSVGTTTTAYDDWKQIITDAEDNVKDLYYDAYNNLIQVDEHNDSSTYTTLYTYNLLGKLTVIQDALSNLRNFTYDGLARLTKSEDLHSSGDSTFGSTTLAYDDSGNLTTKTDAKNQTVNFTYDDINRVLTENYTGTAGTEVSYGYDTCAEGKGRLCSATSTDAIVNYAYSALGSIKTESKKISSSTYITQYDYDLQGNQTLITYPDNSAVKYTFNNAGLLEKVEQKESGGSFADLVSDYDYNAMGQTTYASNANSTETIYTYDPQQLYRLTNKKTTSSAEGASGFASMSQNSSIKISTKKEPLIGEYAVNDLSEVGVADIFNRSSAISNKYKREKAAFVLYNADDQSTMVRIGNDNNAFEPEFNISKWNHEVDFRIKPKKRVEAKVNGLAVENNIIKYKGQDREYHFYDIPSNESYPDGAYELEEILNKKPDSNIFEYDIDTNNLDFFYQPALNDEKLPERATKCSETKCTDAKGNIVAQRPENVVGSYAVYHKEKQGDFSRLGGQNYKSGKAFHIYRPKIKDAVSNWTWGELNIDTQKNKLTIIVPQNWLNRATYPVVVDPTFGYGTIGSSELSLASNELAGSLFASPPNAGTVTSISLYSRDTGLAGLKTAIVLHGNLNFVTNGVSTAGTFSSTLGWRNSTFASSPTISANTDYLLMYITDDANYSNSTYFDTGSTTQGHYDATNSYTTPTNPTDAIHNAANQKLSIYATYTDTGSSTNPGIPTTKDAYSITENTAVLDASLDIKDATSTNLFFQYGLTASYGSTSSIRTLFASSTSATSSIAGLTASTTYHFRAVATSTNSGTPQYGQDKTFTTSIADDPIFVEVIQDLSYTYDKVGNFKQIVDASDLDTAKTIDYMYDDLYRLVRASSTGAIVGGQSSGSQMSMAAMPNYPANNKYISSLYGELMMPSEILDISPLSVADDYNKSEIIKNKYDLVNAAFVQKDTGSNDISVTVGDPASSNFLPELNIGKWNEEIKFKIQPNLSGLASSEQSLSLDGNTIKLSVPDKEYHFYDIPTNTIYPDGAYEFEEILYQKPVSNIIEFDIDTKNLDFYYQSALNKEIVPEGAASCTETECVNDNGEIVFNRPANIVGSYAVYHKEKKGDYTQLGGKNYAAGKAFHIYRPKIKDSKGSWTWGQLNINTEKNKLTITVPQNWLNKAAYPIIVDPTFGYTSAGATESSRATNEIRGTIGAASAGTASKISAYVKSAYAYPDPYGGYIKGIILNTDADIISNGIGGASSISSISDTWVDSTFGTQPTLSAASYYASAIFSKNGTAAIYLHYDSGAPANTGIGENDNNYSSPQNLVGESYYTNYYSVYATYTASGSSTNPGVPTTKDAFSISQNSAVLDASLDIKDATSTNLFFQYGLTTSYGSTSSIKNLIASTTSATTSITSLTASTTYHFRAVATSTNDGTLQYGQDKTFTTSSTPVSYPGQPTTKDAFSITDGSAILDASLDIRNATSTNLFFQYGLTTSYGSTSSIRTLFASSTSATSSILGLTASTTYHFRAVATSTNEGTPQYGQDKTFATSPSPSGPDYLETYTYNAIGNILNKSDQGNYTYTDNGYNNPHAVTSINGTTYSYDNNGDLISDGTWTHSWDYNNRLATSTKTNTVIAYGYDYEGNRVKYNNGSNTTIYPNQYYNTDGSKTTKNIYANGQLIATIEGGKTYYVHTDHLAGSNVISNDEGGVIQILDYYPFGKQRLNEQYGNFDEKKKFTGQPYDAETSLSYFGARYQNGSIGKFISVDPASQNIPEKFLDDPQRLNSYSYTRNNPVNLIDPTGLYDTKNGIVEKGDTPDIIVNAINNAFNIKTNWSIVQEVSFYNTRFKDKSLDQIVGQSLRIGTNMTKDITEKLNNLNKDMAKIASTLGPMSLLNFAPGNKWDLKNGKDAVLGLGSDGQRDFWSYIYSGELIRYDAPGNISYGYVAKSTGLNDWVIQSGAALEQAADDYHNGKGWTFKDNSGDSKYIQKGINSYKSTRTWLQKLINW